MYHFTFISVFANNKVLEKDGEDQLDRSSEKWGLFVQRQGGQEYHTYEKKRRMLFRLVTSCVGTVF